MLKKLKQNDHGVVFVTVLMIIIAMMVLTISVLSLNVSQTKTAEQEVKRVQAEILAQGALFLLLSNQEQASPGTYFSTTETLDNTTFSITANRQTGGSTMGTSIDSVIIDVSPQ